MSASISSSVSSSNTHSFFLSSGWSLLPDNYGDTKADHKKKFREAPPETIIEQFSLAREREPDIRYYKQLSVLSECDSNGKPFPPVLIGKVGVFSKGSIPVLSFDLPNSATDESIIRMAFSLDSNFGIGLCDYHIKTMNFMNLLRLEPPGIDVASSFPVVPFNASAPKKPSSIRYRALERSRRLPNHLYAVVDLLNAFGDWEGYGSIILQYDLSTNALKIDKQYSLKYQSSRSSIPRPPEFCQFFSLIEFSKRFPPSFIIARESSIYLYDIAFHNSFKRIALRLKTKEELLKNVSDEEAIDLLKVYEKLNVTDPCNPRCQFECSKCSPSLPTIIHTVTQSLPPSSSIRSRAGKVLQFIKTDLLSDNEGPSIPLLRDSLNIQRTILTSASGAPCERFFLLTDGVLFVLDDSLNLGSLILLNEMPLPTGAFAPFERSSVSTLTQSNFYPSCICSLAEDLFAVSDKCGTIKCFKQCSSHADHSILYEYECIQTIFASKLPFLKVAGYGGVNQIVAYSGKLYFSPGDVVYMME